MNNDTRNMVLAIALSALVLLGWGLLSERFFPTPKKPVATAPAQPGAPASSTAAATPQAPAAQIGRAHV